MELEFEVLRTGEFTDANGTPVAFDEQGLQQIADSYNPATHEAPLVLGHPQKLPKSGDPAYGWVQKLERRGERLIAHAKQVVPDLLQFIKDGLYKKVSIGLNKDNTLHHVGLLGAQVPAVKGLAEITFSEQQDEITTVTAEADMQGDNQTPPEKLLHETINNEEIEALQKQIKALQEEIHVLTTNQKAPDTSLLAKEADAFSAFIDDALNKGKLTPAQAGLFKGLTDAFKTPDIRTFAENPGQFFSVARKLAAVNASKLMFPARYTQAAPKSNGSFESARSAIARNMQTV